MCLQVKDIVSLRLSHCRAERAAAGGQYHLAALHYRSCLEAAEYSGDCRAVHFFALRLAECYDAMNLGRKALGFRNLAKCAGMRPAMRSAEAEGDGPAATPLV